MEEMRVLRLQLKIIMIALAVGFLAGLFLLVLDVKVPVVEMGFRGGFGMALVVVTGLTLPALICALYPPKRSIFGL